MLKLKLKNVELTLEEAKELYNELHTIFGKPNTAPIYPAAPFPTDPWGPYKDTPIYPGIDQWVWYGNKCDDSKNIS